MIVEMAGKIYANEHTFGEIAFNIPVTIGSVSNLQSEMPLKL